MTDPEILEAVARAICDARMPVKEYSVWDKSLGAADKAALLMEAQAAIDAHLQSISETHAMVRREPTKKMVSAARQDWHNNHGPQSQTLYGENIYGIWAAMLKAAEEKT